MVDIRIDLRGDQKRLQNIAKLAPGQIQRVSRKVINQVVDETTREAGGLIPRDAGTSITGYRRVRSKKKRAKASRRKLSAEIWQGTARIPARYAGRAREVSGGVRVGRLFFPGAFIATMRNGYTAIFKRKAKGRYPLEQEFIYPDNAPRIMQRLATNAERTLRDRIEQETKKVIRGIK